MSNQDNQSQQRPEQEVKIEDLPVDETATEQIKGGPFDGIGSKPSGGLNT